MIELAKEQYPEGHIFYDASLDDYVFILEWFRTYDIRARVFYIRENKEYSPHYEYIESHCKGF